MRFLPSITGPQDLKKLSVPHLQELAAEIRQAICDQVARTLLPRGENHGFGRAAVVPEGL